MRNSIRKAGCAVGSHLLRFGKCWSKTRCLVPYLGTHWHVISDEIQFLEAFALSAHPVAASRVFMNIGSGCCLGDLKSISAVRRWKKVPRLLSFEMLRSLVMEVSFTLWRKITRAT